MLRGVRACEPQFVASFLFWWRFLQISVDLRLGFLLKVFMKRVLLSIFIGIFLSVEVPTFALQLVPGSPLAPENATMPVSILNFVPVINALADGVFITAATPGAEAYALAGYKMPQHQFVPYAEQSVLLNGVQTTNPLYNAQIDFVAFMTNVPGALYAVPNKNSSQIFYRPSTGLLFSRDTLPDAAGNPAAGIVSLVGSSLSTVTYGAVIPSTATHFGDVGSGIATIFIQTDAILTAPTTPLDNTNVAFTLDTNPVTIPNNITLTWSQPLSMVYGALDEVISGSGVTDRASLVARALPVQNGMLLITSILNPTFDPSTFVTGTNYIVLAQGASVTGVSSNLQLMQTSTRQPLLLVVGRMLNAGETSAMVQNQVYAMPLTYVLNPETTLEEFVQTESGFLAKKGGGLGDPALVASDLYQPTDAAVQVGQGLLPSDAVVNELIVNGDVVYAVVNNVLPLSGVYASRALFNAEGVVTSWTPWIRIAPTPPNIFGVALNTLSGVWFELTTTEVTADTVFRTTWQTNDTLTGVAQAIMNFTGSSTQTQSITALAGYDYRTGGMGNISALVTVERNQVLFTQTGVGIPTTSLLYAPLSADAYNASVIAENTELTTPVGTVPVVVIRGGIFNTMAPLTTAAIVHSDTLPDSWLCVGGNGGVTIWATSAGAGWGAAFGDDLNALPVGLQMYQLGSYTDVRQLYADGSLLYVATPYQVDRIDLTEGITITDGVAVPQSAPVTVATSGSLTGNQASIITNMLFSQELGFIATTVGLYQTLSGTSALDMQPLWQRAFVPESEFPLETITAFGLDGTGATLSQGGNCWVLSGTARNNRSVLNRLAVSSITGTVTSTTVQPFFCDYYIKTKQGVKPPSYFLDFGQYKDVVVSDGAEYFFARSVEGFEPATITTPNILGVLTQPRSTNRFVGVQAIPVLELPLDGGSDIITLLQEPATGSWYLVTNMGLIVQG